MILTGPAKLQGEEPGSGIEAAEEKVVLPRPVPDPLEPINRSVWAFNRSLMKGVIHPTARVYRWVICRPVRTGIRNFNRNIHYPGRLLNNLLQGNWGGARDESYRFLCNTVVGVAGFRDVATKWDIPMSDADFGETFGQWGWRPNFFLMLPLYGPSNDRDAVGLAADNLTDPLNYVPTLSERTGSGVFDFSPYSYYSFGALYNNLSDTVDEYVRFGEAEMDSYWKVQYAWGFARENRVVNYQVEGEQDPASLETLESVFFTFKDRSFPNRGRTRSAAIPSTGEKLKFTYWLQREKAPVVYIIPGLGSHRLADSALALAELVYQKGYSSVCVSSTFHPEFMEHASTASVPAYLPVDGADLHAALTAVDRRLEALYPGRLGARGLAGYSMGAFQALYLAGTAGTNQAGMVRFDRYLAINPPVRLLYGVSKLDAFYKAPLVWPEEEREERIENTFLKVAALTKTSLAPETTLPFSAAESRFLIGVAFRLILRDVIFSSQRRDNQGILKQPIRKLRRNAVYDEILDYSYADYLAKFVVPYYATRGIDLSSPGALEAAENLRTYGAGLKGNEAVRLVLSRNDFLLNEADLDWLQTVAPPEHVWMFEEGGHLGNLKHPEVQKAIASALDSLGSIAPRR